MSSKIIEAFTSGNYDAIPLLVEQSIKGNIDPLFIMNEELVPGIRAVGEQFQRGEVYLPEMMLASESWQEGMKFIQPILEQQKIKIESSGKVVIGTVKGDIHALGKNIVISLLMASNFEIIDLGVDVSASRFVEEAINNRADIIAASALMTTTIPQQKEIIAHLDALNKREDFYVMVGGGPTTTEWAKEIHADGYGETAADAVKMASKYMEQKKKGFN